MSRTKKKYTNGQSRGGTSPSVTDTTYGTATNRNGSPKDYHRQAVAFHGGELKLEEFLERLKG